MAIKQAAGVTPLFARAPYGDIDDRIRFIAKSLGYRLVQWDLDSHDYSFVHNRRNNMSEVLDSFRGWVRENPKHGHISLQHDLYKETVLQAQTVVPIVQDAGYNIMPVSVCTNANAYREDVTLDASDDPTDLDEDIKGDDEVDDMLDDIGEDDKVDEDDEDDEDDENDKKNKHGKDKDDIAATKKSDDANDTSSKDTSAGSRIAQSSWGQLAALTVAAFFFSIINVCTIGGVNGR